jgi:GGDEF domain-containing protein
LPSWEITTWIAVGASALAAILLLTSLVLAARLRRARQQPLEPPGDEAKAEAEAERAWEEVRRERAQSTRARSELRWLRHLGDVGAQDTLETTLRRVLESASGLAGAAASMLALPQEEGDPLIATFGLNSEESSRELLGLPPGGEEARAVTLSYRYGEEEAERDEFRLSGGLALPVPDSSGARIGTLGIFWRRVEREVTEEELEQLEGLAAALGPALTNAFRFEKLRRELDVDLATGLRGRRSLRAALDVECARARRYTHPLSLLLLGVEAPAERLGTAAERLEGAVRTTDLVYHLAEGRFAVLLPESSRRDADRLSRRLRFALGAKEAGVIDGPVPTAAVELRFEDDAVSVLARAEAALAQARVESGTGSSWSAAVEPGG